MKVSLEEKKINRKKRKALDLANKEKDKIRCLVYGLKERFKRVLLDNESLPEPLRFDRDYFQFDERLNRSLVEEARSEMDKLHLKLSPDYKKSILGLKNVKNYFVDKIITDEFEVEAISYVFRIILVFVWECLFLTRFELNVRQEKHECQNNIPRSTP